MLPEGKRDCVPKMTARFFRQARTPKAESILIDSVRHNRQPKVQMDLVESHTFFEAHPDYGTARTLGQAAHLSRLLNNELSSPEAMAFRG